MTDPKNKQTGKEKETKPAANSTFKTGGNQASNEDDLDLDAEETIEEDQDFSEDDANEAPGEQSFTR